MNEHCLQGTITFGIDFRNFDFREWYKDWTEPPMPHVSLAYFIVAFTAG